MQSIVLPYSGELLLTQLMAYGTLVVLDRTGARCTIQHDPESLTYDPIVAMENGVSEAAVAEALADTALALRDVIEADLVPGAKGNDRKSVIWARGSFAGDESKAREPVAKRAQLLDTTEGRSAQLAVDLLAALGCPATWGGGDVKPSWGATALDGVLGNYTADFVRGLLRFARAAAEQPDQPLWDAPSSAQQVDKTMWAPPDTKARLDHQWLAVLGMMLLPVAHRSHERSRTPAVWRAPVGRRSGVSLPLFSQPTSLARLRAVLASAAFPKAAQELVEAGQADVRTATVVRSLGVNELALYERQDARGSGSSVAFSFGRGILVRL